MADLKLDLMHAARTLAISAWRRDFEQHSELQREVLQGEVSALFNALRLGTGLLAGLMYEGHTLKLRRNILRLAEGEGLLVDCRISMKNIGKVELQYTWRGQWRGREERSDEVQLIRNGKHEYGWLCGSQILSRGELTVLILQSVLEIGSRVVSFDVKNNPKLPRPTNA